MTHSNPYENLPDNSFWRSGVVSGSPYKMNDIYQKKWDIAPKDSIATAGSCFAQHISRYMNAYNFNVINLEPAPYGLPNKLKSSFGFDMYSSRYGNIYTAKQLLQLAKEVTGDSEPSEIVWTKDGKYYDAHRPAVEPGGFSSSHEVIIHRNIHLQKVLQMFEMMDIFVFTLGLTEAWMLKDSQTVFPTAPGTIAGNYDKEKYELKVFQFNEVISDLMEFDAIMQKLRAGKPKLRYIFTVSPVPLTATASKRHVLQATLYSKSVLRAVAGQLADDFPHIDYFPSYEIITNPAMRSMFYKDNLRSIRDEGVEVVMNAFFSQHLPQSSRENTSDNNLTIASNPEDYVDMMDDDVQCEEAILEAFGK